MNNEITATDYWTLALLAFITFNYGFFVTMIAVFTLISMTLVHCYKKVIVWKVLSILLVTYLLSLGWGTSIIAAILFMISCNVASSADIKMTDESI